MLRLRSLNVICRQYGATAGQLQEISLRAVAHQSVDQLQIDSKQIVNGYKHLPVEEKNKFIGFLASECSVNHSSLKTAISKYEKNSNAFYDVFTAAAPLYSKIFQSIGNLEAGVKFVCDFRADVHQFIRSDEAKKLDLLSLRRLEKTLHDFLTLWFCLSNLQLRRLTWESPADILQKVAKGEAVHPIQGLIDMQRRLGPSRRCYIFEHPAMPREPLVIVYVALTDKISDNVQKIMKQEDLSLEDENTATTAIYYSITSTQPGLQGVDLGNLLIKNVAAKLIADHPNIENHSTLSPIPGFRNWLLRSLHGHSEFGEVVDAFVESELRTFPALIKASVAEMRLDLISLIETNDVPKYAKLKDVFLHLAGVYLTQAKNSHGYALNPVTNFHLRNGAEIYRVNFAADLSKKSIDQAMGMMVNYRYVMENVSKNAQDYAENKKIAMGTDFAYKLGVVEKAKI